MKGYSSKKYFEEELILSSVKLTELKIAEYFQPFGLATNFLRAYLTCYGWPLGYLRNFYYP
jgi:hypothetical protein